MALNSPRFKGEHAFERIDQGHDIIARGATGRHIHILQMALIDLGFPMPISTMSRHYSPDGVYGAETEAVVAKFQKVNPPLQEDGEVGLNTLRKIDDLVGGFKHRVRLHFRSLALSDVPFDRILSSAQKVYAQYAIDISFASGQSLGLSAEEESRFTTVAQNCVWDVSGGEFESLHKLGTPVPGNDIKVFIVNKFQEGNVVGCGGHAVGHPACAVTHDAPRWDMAHEVGHVLLTSSFDPVHSDSKRNLMYFAPSGDATPLTFTEKQLGKIRSSPLCRTI